MKFVALVLLAPLLNAPAPARAQEAPLAQSAKAKSGSELLVEALALVKDGPNGEPSAPDILAPDENLRRQRLAVARNAPALAKLRAALKADIGDFASSQTGTLDFPMYARVRELARQLWQESAVRAADGDAPGAAESSLDALELSAQAARGPIIGANFGVATAALARQSLTPNIGALGAAQLREVANRWEKISANFPTYAQTLRDEEQVQLLWLRQNSAAEIAAWNDPVRRAAHLSELQQMRAEGRTSAATILALDGDFVRSEDANFADLVARLRAHFDEALARANRPYLAATTAPPVRAIHPLVALGASVANMRNPRFFAERNLADNRLFIAALRLRAIKLETGAYPATFGAGADPFSPALAPLIYKRVGEAYLLYSVGPDGVDDGGAKLRALVTNPRTGAQTVSEALRADSTGDIVAPVL